MKKWNVNIFFVVFLFRGRTILNWNRALSATRLHHTPTPTLGPCTHLMDFNFRYLGTLISSLIFEYFFQKLTLAFYVLLNTEVQFSSTSISHFKSIPVQEASHILRISILTYIFFRINFKFHILNLYIYRIHFVGEIDHQMGVGGPTP